jgi:isochorismate hydrolase
MAKIDRKRRMREIVKAHQQYVATYTNQAHYQDYEDRTFINDMLYGIGLALDKDKFFGADGFVRFKEMLRAYLPVDGEPK